MIPEYHSFATQRESLFSGLTGKCPVNAALEGGIKGHNIKGNYFTGKPRPLGCGASFLDSLIPADFNTGCQGLWVFLIEPLS